MNKELFAISFMVTIISCICSYGMQNQLSHDQLALSYIGHKTEDTECRDENKSDDREKESMFLSDEDKFNCWFGHKQALAFALESESSLVYKIDFDGKTLLALAVHAGHECMVDLLLAHKADINAVDHKGNSVLMYAATDYSGLSMVRHLIHKGANLSQLHPQKQKMAHEIVFIKALRRSSIKLAEIAEVLEKSYKAQYEVE
ncbi:MAG: ankyrin repeat domain-containing protein [Candidatus Dependentiae bacterium]|nr:ankyrin repeat domain-containing protein [Candidatus Dependentiae bacterium]